ncbi:MAG: hypothetical protein LBN26_09950 [Christensenellaceae bacterium]|nr:hypothetical protein [Christensenellaceae bacterium]
MAYQSPLIRGGFFANDADLLYQDEITGSLIGIADRVLDTIYTKYFKGLIHYEGIQRVDHYPMLRDVLREVVLNAVFHKDYSTGNPIHIKTYDDKRNSEMGLCDVTCNTSLIAITASRSDVDISAASRSRKRLGTAEAV